MTDGMTKLRTALRAEMEAESAPPSHLPVTVTLRTRPANWHERETLFCNYYIGDDETEEALFYHTQRRDIVANFWPGLLEWLANRNNVADFYIARYDVGLPISPVAVMTFHFRDDEDAMLFKLRWLR